MEAHEVAEQARFEKYGPRPMRTRVTFWFRKSWSVTFTFGPTFACDPERPVESLEERYREWLRGDGNVN